MEIEDVEIQKQQVVGWAIVTRKDGDDSWKVAEPIVSPVGYDGAYHFEEKEFRLVGDITGILPAAPGTYRITTNFENDLIILGISHPGDGFPDEEWLSYAFDVVSWQEHLAEQSCSNNQVKKPVHSSNCLSIK